MYVCQSDDKLLKTRFICNINCTLLSVSPTYFKTFRTLYSIVTQTLHFRFLVIVSALTTRATFAQFLQPVALNTANSECALILPGGARSSAYDHTLSLFRVGEL